MVVQYRTYHIQHPSPETAETLYAFRRAMFGRIGTHVFGCVGALATKLVWSCLRSRAEPSIVRGALTLRQTNRQLLRTLERPCWSRTGKTHCRSL